MGAVRDRSLRQRMHGSDCVCCRDVRHCAKRNTDAQYYKIVGGPAPRAKAVWVEVREAHRYNFDLEVGIVGHSTQGHERYSGFEREQIRAVMTTA